MRSRPISIRSRAAIAAGSIGLAMLMAAPGAAQTFGRLFSTVEERIKLDELRAEYEYGKPPPRPEPSPAAAAGAAPPVVPQVTVNGVVLRSSGYDASWINGFSILAGDATPEGIRVEPGPTGGGSVRLIMPSGIDTIRIKAGQKIDVVTGKVLDAYQFDAGEAQSSVFAKAATGAEEASSPAGRGAASPKPPAP